jgi:hypothetical protein
MTSTAKTAMTPAMAPTAIQTTNPSNHAKTSGVSNLTHAFLFIWTGLAGVAEARFLFASPSPYWLICARPPRMSPDH